MVHACACCSLRFATNGELAHHVHEEHEEHPPFTEHKDSVAVRRPWPAGAGARAGGRPAP